ncbi:MAG: hypothetical protein MI976_02235 [Pseudomonadales bacterium]|nr:hypothetical protein [Pseudomonadales bacterium]
MLGFFYLYLSTLLEKYTYYHTNQAQDKDFQSFISLGICALILFTIHFIFSDTPTTYSFFSDYTFYLWFLSEFSAFFCFRKATLHNVGNYVTVSFAVFSTTYMVPMVAYLYDQIFQYENSIRTPYSSFLEAVGVSVFLFLGTLAYFYDKIQTQVKGKKWMIMLSFSLINTIYFSTKLVQSYDGFLVYGFITLLMSVQFLLISLINKEPVNPKRIFSCGNLVKSLSWTPVVLFDVLAMQYLAVEFVAIFRRTNQILSGMTIDYFFAKKKRIPSLKDGFVIAVLISFALSYYFYKF